MNEAQVGALKGMTVIRPPQRWNGLHRKVSARDVPAVSSTPATLLWEQQEWNAEVTRRKAMRTLRRLRDKGLSMPGEVA